MINKIVERYFRKLASLDFSYEELESNIHDDDYLREYIKNYRRKVRNISVSSDLIRTMFSIAHREKDKRILNLLNSLDHNQQWQEILSDNGFQKWGNARSFLYLKVGLSKVMTVSAAVALYDGMPLLKGGELKEGGGSVQVTGGGIKYERVYGNIQEMVSEAIRIKDELSYIKNFMERIEDKAHYASGYPGLYVKYTGDEEKNGHFYVNAMLVGYDHNGRYVGVAGKIKIDKDGYIITDSATGRISANIEDFVKEWRNNF